MQSFDFNCHKVSTVYLQNVYEIAIAFCLVLVALTCFHSRFRCINRVSSVELMMHVRRFTIRYRVHNTACSGIMHQHISFVACHWNNDNFIQCEAKLNANDEDTSYRIQLLYF